MLWETISRRMDEYPRGIVTDGETCFTYGRLRKLAEEFSKELRGRSCCAVLCKSDLMTGAALLSCFAAGVTAVPLSYRYGKRHIQKIMDFIRPPYIISDGGGRLSVRGTGSGGYDSPEDHAAVIMSTSGTTGEPKGVMLSEENLLCNVEGISDYFDVRRGDRILITRPLYHSSALTGEFLLALYKGMDIRFYGGGFNPSVINRIIATDRINVLCATPTVLSLLCDLKPEVGGKDVLTTISVSGECLTSGMAEKLRRAFPKADIYSVYGLTEASPRVSFLPPAMFCIKDGCVGYPLASTDIAISGGNPDRMINTVDEKRVGEVLVKGPGVMMGYYKNRALTEKVLKDGWLHTGDIGFIDDCGMLCIKGRADDMIIRAGMNIYPSEIEGEITKDPCIRHAVASGYADKSGIMRIALTVAGEIENSPSGREYVVSLCRRALPEYMQPSHIEIAESTETGITGKTKRKQRKAEGVQADDRP